MLESGRNRRIAEALPGIFVALGIFGTFLGLVLGLKDLKLDQLETLKDSVGHLVSGLSLAFLDIIGRHRLIHNFFHILPSFNPPVGAGPDGAR